MPSYSTGLPTHSPDEFCLALKATRERKGITLAQISNTTKIPSSVFAALERGDLGRWPKGLFRRSFFRDYAGAIGLPVREACAEFVRLFPDDTNAPATQGAAPIAEVNQAEDVRLVLDAAWHGPRGSVRSRVLAGLIDAGNVLLVALLIAWPTGLDRLATTAFVALGYFFLSTALLDESAGHWILFRRHPKLEAMRKGPLGIASAWHRGTAALSNAWQSADSRAPEPAEDPEIHEWITDAHRVGPAPRLRVRIKVSQ